jgi:hypothetical protein
MYNPLTIHPGIPATPQIASRAATTARISIVIAHDNIFSAGTGLKACQPRMRNANNSPLET